MLLDRAMGLMLFNLAKGPYYCTMVLVDATGWMHLVDATKHACYWFIILIHSTN